ncbi:LysR family transcriptional regulator [Ktedonosporobacter rubrisoli]|uniref:LysR family transcriptional regulator n=1 Tax=Ktedonosporobacter rubrisoli TaxID=2509675 RepID=A0A4P6JID2_KTERU|nr:selenium metabolism-associated LysR family transcriptional regulator [Ktedonosporobacter rubrisoli]QBD74819.1 LysR family transcriptional regulator [Ktedonosporobacter rubrisoli]
MLNTWHILTSASKEQAHKAMNFNQLLIFHKVAQKGHFTRAAEELFISQPAVSKQIQELEKALKQALFTRSGSKIYLTEAGKVLYEYAERIFALSTEAEAVLDDMQNLRRGRLAVGASTTIGTYLLPELLGEYKERYPAIDMTIEIANTEDIQQEVLTHRLEIGIVEGTVSHPELTQQAWQQDRLVLITSASFARKLTDPVTLQQIFAQQPTFILREQGSGTREILEQALSRRGIGPLYPMMELGSTEAIKRAVAAGLGISFVSEHTIQLEIATGRLKQIALSDCEIERQLTIVSVKGKRISRAALAFLDLLTHIPSGIS